MCRILPPIHEKIYFCKEPYYMRIVGSIIPKNVISMINVNDINSAVMTLGGKICKESDIISIITKDIQKKIRNIKREIECIRLQEIGMQVKNKKIKNRQVHVNRLKMQLQNIEDRIKNTMDQEKVDKESAEEIIEHADKAQLKYFNDAFQKNPLDPSSYHCVINSSKIDFEKSTDIVVDMIKELNKK